MASFPFFIEKPTKTPGAALHISSVLRGCLYVSGEADKASCVTTQGELWGLSVAGMELRHVSLGRAGAGVMGSVPGCHTSPPDVSTGLRSSHSRPAWDTAHCGPPLWHCAEGRASLLPFLLDLFF